MLKVIWFNRWFSTVGHYIELIKNNKDNKKYHIIGTHPSKSTVYFNSCDESFVEPDISGDSYIEYCLSFCVENEVDIFIPRKEALLISKNIERFNDIGVSVMVASHDKLEKLEDKILMNDILLKEIKSGNKIIDVPESYEATTASEFIVHYNTLISNGCEVCVKPVRGEGGLGFWKIIKDEEQFESIITKTSTNKITAERFYNLLLDYELRGNAIPPLMVLEYLSGPEYSVDCLADKNGNLLVAIPRGKGLGGRVRVLDNNKDYIEIAERIARKFKIPYIYNIQFRLVNGIPKFLEVNARMSGGMYMSCMSGANLPYNAVQVLSGEDLGKEDIKYELGLEITYIESPRVL